MALSATHPVRLSVEIEAETYEALLRMIAKRGTTPTLDDILAEMKQQWRASFIEALSEAAQEPQALDALLRDVEIELRIVQRGTDNEANAIEDDDADIRASIKQGLREVLSGDVLTEEEFWKAVAEDE